MDGDSNSHHGLLLRTSVFVFSPYINSLGFDSDYFLTMDELLNITDSTPFDICPNFLASSMSLLDLLIKGAVVLGYAARLRRRRRGKRAVALVRFRERGLRSDLFLYKPWLVQRRDSDFTILFS